MKNLKMFAAFAAVGMAVAAFAEGGLTEAQQAVAKAGPKKLRLMIAGFGTVESMTQVEKWLGEQLQPNNALTKPATLTEGEKLQNPDLANEIVRNNWNTRKLECIRLANEVAAENQRNKQLLKSLRMKVLTDAATRYVPLAKDYLQAALSRQCGTLIQVVDRSNADMSMVEQELNGNHSSSLAGATCIATVTLGDREESSTTVTVNGKGTQVMTTTYTQPYVGKIRDLDGNVLVAFSGTAEVSGRANSIVKTEGSDPARKLVESVCEKIAADIAKFFTTTLEFKVKAPEGSDADEAVILIDGKNVDAEGGVRVLAVEHALVATLEGCDPVERVIAIDGTTPTKKVKIVFKKKAEEKPAEAKPVEAKTGDNE